MNIGLIIAIVAFIAAVGLANAVIMIEVCNGIRNITDKLENIAKEINEHENG